MPSCGPGAARAGGTGGMACGGVGGGTYSSRAKPAVGRCGTAEGEDGNGCQGASPGRNWGGCTVAPVAAGAPVTAEAAGAASHAATWRAAGATRAVPAPTIPSPSRRRMPCANESTAISIRAGGSTARTTLGRHSSMPSGPRSGWFRGDRDPPHASRTTPAAVTAGVFVTTRRVFPGGVRRAGERLPDPWPAPHQPGAAARAPAGWRCRSSCRCPRPRR